MVMKHFQKVLKVIIQQMRLSVHVLKQHTGCTAWSKKLIGHKRIFFPKTYTDIHINTKNGTDENLV